jgi:hypothetical protein
MHFDIFHFLQDHKAFCLCCTVLFATHVILSPLLGRNLRQRLSKQLYGSAFRCRPQQQPCIKATSLSAFNFNDIAFKFGIRCYRPNVIQSVPCPRPSQPFTSPHFSPINRCRKLFSIILRRNFNGPSSLAKKSA